MGRLARDPDVKSTQSGMTYARMTLAVDRRISRAKQQEGQQTADFIGLIAWDKTAEFAEKYIGKGRQILVEGRIQTGSYEKDGQKHYTTDVVCERIEFADSRPQNGAANGDTPSNAASVQGDEVGDDDIPF